MPCDRGASTLPGGVLASLHGHQKRALQAREPSIEGVERRRPCTPGGREDHQVREADTTPAMVRRTREAVTAAPPRAPAAARSCARHVGRQSISLES